MPRTSARSNCSTWALPPPADPSPRRALPPLPPGEGPGVRVRPHAAPTVATCATRARNSTRQAPRADLEARTACACRVPSACVRLHPTRVTFTPPPRPRLEECRPPSRARAVPPTRCGRAAGVVPSSWSNAMPDRAGGSRFRALSSERRRRLRQWARLRQGMCVTLACLAVALAPSWDARSAPLSSQALLHALRVLAPVHGRGVAVCVSCRSSPPREARPSPLPHGDVGALRKALAYRAAALFPGSGCRCRSLPSKDPPWPISNLPSRLN